MLATNLVHKINVDGVRPKTVVNGGKRYAASSALKRGEHHVRRVERVNEIGRKRVGLFAAHRRMEKMAVAFCSFDVRLHNRQAKRRRPLDRLQQFCDRLRASTKPIFEFPARTRSSISTLIRSSTDIDASNDSLRLLSVLSEI